MKNNFSLSKIFHPYLFFLLGTVPAFLHPDTIFLKNGFHIDSVDIIEANHRRLIFVQNASRNTMDLREISRIELSSRPDSVDSVVLRNGSVITGSILSVRYDAVEIRESGQSVPAVIAASDITSAVGSQRFLSYRTEDDTAFLLISRVIHFEAGKPVKSLQDSKYRFIVSGFGVLSAAGTNFAIPGKSNGGIGAGYGMNLEIAQQQNVRDAVVYGFMYTENPFTAPDSLGNSFSAWKNIVVTIGFRRHFTPDILNNNLVFAEGKIGALISTPPENANYLFEKGFAATWNVTVGWYVTHGVSMTASYMFSSPEFVHTVITRGTLPKNVKGVISFVHFGLNYSIGSGM